MSNLPFFLLPFCLFTSIVTNALGYYAFLFLYPILYVIKFKIQIPRYVKTMSLVLFCMYFCFVISDFLNLFFQSPVMDSSFYKNHFRFSKLLKSRLSTSYLTTSIFLFILFYISKINIKYNTQTITHIYKNTLKSTIPKPLESFLKGSLWASGFFSVFFLLEYLFNFDYRDLISCSNFKINPDFSNHVFRRPTGLLGNPLTIASMSLAYFSFFYTYFCLCFFREKNYNHVPFVHNKKKLIFYLFIPSIFFLFILFLTLARLAILIAFILVLFMPLLCASKKNIFKVLTFITAFALIGYIVCDALGYVDRVIFGLKQLVQNGHMDNRAYFRKIYTQMFLDKPWIGNGYYWLHEGIRDKYFVLLGYDTLNERNFPAHNLYLEILASGGIFCASIIIYGIYKLQKILKTYVMNAHFKNKTLWFAFITSIIANLLHAFTQNNFLESSTTYAYFYLILVIFWDKILVTSSSR